MEHKDFFTFIYRFLIFLFIGYSIIGWCNGTINAYYWNKESSFFIVMFFILSGVMSGLTLIKE